MVHTHIYLLVYFGPERQFCYNTEEWYLVDSWEIKMLFLVPEYSRIDSNMILYKNVVYVFVNGSGT